MRNLIFVAALILTGSAVKAADLSANCSPDQISIICPQTITSVSSVTWSGQQSFLRPVNVTSSMTVDDSAEFSGSNPGYDEFNPVPAGTFIVTSTASVQRNASGGLSMMGLIGGDFLGFGYGDAGGTFTGICHGGTESAPTACLEDDVESFIGGKGYDGVDSWENIGSNAGTFVFAGEDQSPTTRGSYMFFGTTKIGTTARRNRVAIYDDGAVAIAPRANVITPQGQLDVKAFDPVVGSVGTVSIYAHEAIVAVTSMTAGAFFGDGSHLTGIASAPGHAGGFSSTLNVGTTFFAFVPDSAITLKRITVTVVVAGVGGAGDTYSCQDASNHKVSVTVSAAAAAGTVTTATGAGAISAGTQVSGLLSASTAITSPVVNVLCEY